MNKDFAIRVCRLSNGYINFLIMERKSNQLNLLIQFEGSLKHSLNDCEFDDIIIFWKELKPNFKKLETIRARNASLWTFFPKQSDGKRIWLCWFHRRSMVRHFTLRHSLWHSLTYSTLIAAWNDLMIWNWFFRKDCCGRKTILFKVSH